MSGPRRHCRCTLATVAVRNTAHGCQTFSLEKVRKRKIFSANPDSYEPPDSKRMQFIYILAKPLSGIKNTGKNKSQRGRTQTMAHKPPQPACFLPFRHQISLRHVNQNFWGLNCSQDIFLIFFFFLSLKDSSLSPFSFFEIFQSYRELELGQPFSPVKIFQSYT